MYWKVLTEVQLKHFPERFTTSLNYLLYPKRFTTSLGDLPKKKPSPTSWGTHQLPFKSLKNLSDFQRKSQKSESARNLFIRWRWWLKMSQKLPRPWSAIQKWGEKRKTTQQSIEEKSHQTSQQYIPRT